MQILEKYARYVTVRFLSFDLAHRTGKDLGLLEHRGRTVILDYSSVHAPLYTCGRRSRGVSDTKTDGTGIRIYTKLAIAGAPRMLRLCLRRSNCTRWAWRVGKCCARLIAEMPAVVVQVDSVLILVSCAHTVCPLEGVDCCFWCIYYDTCPPEGIVFQILSHDWSWRPHSQRHTDRRRLAR